jgi:hypothetical protein
MARDGFTVQPQRVPIRLASGARQVVSVQARVADEIAAGEYPIQVELVNHDGRVELTRTIPLQHLGARVRRVIPASGDVAVGQRFPDRNFGTAAVLMVDGGESTMGDAGHAVALLKFQVDVPGRVVSVRMRLHNAGNPSSDSGNVRLINSPWSEKDVTYQDLPEFGEIIARLGQIAPNEIVECQLPADKIRPGEVCLAIDPVNTDAANYITREGGKAPSLVVEFVPEP